MNKEISKLSEKLKITGISIPDLYATLVERTDEKAWYKRDDDVHEVFKIKIAPEQEIYGRQYPEREKYPGNEDFGHWAWCFNNEKSARKKYEQI